MSCFSGLKMKRKVNEIKRYYENEKLSESYISNRFVRPLGRLIHNNQVSFLNKFINKNNIKTVMDLACGPARISKDIVGIESGIAADNSAPMLKIAKKYLDNKWKTKKIDAFKLNINKKFDLVFSFKFIRHFDLKKRAKLYNNIKKLLGRNSYFICDVPNKKVYNWHTKKYPSPVYDEFWNRSTITEELNKNGFFIVKLVPNVKHFKIQEFLSKFSKIKLLTYFIYLLLRLIEKLPS